METKEKIIQGTRKMRKFENSLKIYFYKPNDRTLFRLKKDSYPLTWDLFINNYNKTVENYNKYVNEFYRKPKNEKNYEYKSVPKYFLKKEYWKNYAEELGFKDESIKYLPFHYESGNHLICEFFGEHNIEFNQTLEENHFGIYYNYTKYQFNLKDVEGTILSRIVSEQWSSLIWNNKYPPGGVFSRFFRKRYGITKNDYIEVLKKLNLYDKYTNIKISTLQIMFDELPSKYNSEWFSFKITEDFEEVGNYCELV
jgi:hypothetical protein